MNEIGVGTQTKTARSKLNRGGHELVTRAYARACVCVCVCVDRVKATSYHRWKVRYLS